MIRASKSVVLNDNKQHIMAFGGAESRIYDVDPPEVSYGSRTPILEAKKISTKQIGWMKKHDKQLWEIIRADACAAYHFLQQKGLMLGYQRVEPIWSMHTFSGRSKAEGFSIQNQDGPISNINGDRVFLHFDWVSADMRAVAIMSGDPELNKSFEDSDPYAYMASQIEGLERSECKTALLASIYSLDHSNPAMHFYEGVRQWVIKCQNRLIQNNSLKSILKREFHVTNKRTERSVFNATIQGSVAHAMQLCLKRAWDIFPDNVLTENHDSLVMTCSGESGTMKNIISEVSKIMVCPFEGILKSNPRFPVVVSIGKQYKRWQKYKRYQ